MKFKLQTAIAESSHRIPLRNMFAVFFELYIIKYCQGQRNSIRRYANFVTSPFFFYFGLRNIGLTVRETVYRGLRFLMYQHVLFNYCCSRACKFKATLTIPRPVSTSVLNIHLHKTAG